MNSPNIDSWEVVHMVHDFWDCPRSGVADFRGKPHAFRAAWNEKADDYSDVYELSPIDSAHLEAVKEAWEIWLRWSKANAANALGPGDDHPVLAIDRKRHQEFQNLVAEALRTDAGIAIRAVPTFRSETNQGYQVRWELR